MPLARELKRLDPECRIVYIGLIGDKLDGLQKDYEIFDEVRYVRSGKFRRYHGQSFLAHLADVKTLLLNAQDFFKVMAGTASSRRLLKKLQPDVVFSKGGYVAVPVGLAANQLNIPIITHDSDALPGLANRIIGRRARLHTTAMPKQYYPYPKEKTLQVGIPVDEAIKLVDKAQASQYKKQVGIPAEALVLFISGGGMGSKHINDQVVKMAPTLLKTFPELHIDHIAGTLHEQQVKQDYQASLDKDEQTRVRAYGFTDEFYKHSGAADVVITRAGATTLAQLAIQAKACIIIPAPFLTGGHQIKNAQIFTDSSAAIVLEEDTPLDQMEKVISELLSSSQKRAELSQKIIKLAHPNAAKELAGAIIKVAEG